MTGMSRRWKFYKIVVESRLVHSFDAIQTQTIRIANRLSGFIRDEHQDKMFESIFVPDWHKTKWSWSLLAANTWMFYLWILCATFRWPIEQEKIFVDNTAMCMIELRFSVLCAVFLDVTVVVALLSVFISFGPFSHAHCLRGLVCFLCGYYYCCCSAVWPYLSSFPIDLCKFSVSPCRLTIRFLCPIVVSHIHTYTFRLRSLRRSRVRIRLFISKCSLEPRCCACASLSSLLWRAEHANGIDERDLLWPIFMRQTHFNEIPSIGIHYGPHSTPYTEQARK